MTDVAHGVYLRAGAASKVLDIERILVDEIGGINLRQVFVTGVNIIANLYNLRLGHQWLYMLPFDLVAECKFVNYEDVMAIDIGNEERGDYHLPFEKIRFLDPDSFSEIAYGDLLYRDFSFNSDLRQKLEKVRHLLGYPSMDVLYWAAVHAIQWVAAHLSVCVLAHDYDGKLLAIDPDLPMEFRERIRPR